MENKQCWGGYWREIKQIRWAHVIAPMYQKFFSVHSSARQNLAALLCLRVRIWSLCKTQWLELGGQKVDAERLSKMTSFSLWLSIDLCKHGRELLSFREKKKTKNKFMEESQCSHRAKNSFYSKKMCIEKPCNTPLKFIM